MISEFRSLWAQCPVSGPSMEPLEDVGQAPASLPTWTASEKQGGPGPSPSSCLAPGTPADVGCPSGPKQRVEAGVEGPPHLGHQPSARSLGLLRQLCTPSLARSRCPEHLSDPCGFHVNAPRAHSHTWQSIWIQSERQLSTLATGPGLFRRRLVPARVPCALPATSLAPLGHGR